METRSVSPVVRFAAPTAVIGSAVLAIVAFFLCACGAQNKKVQSALPVYGPHESYQADMAMMDKAYLKLIADAIEAYRKDHAGQVPPVPAALVPHYLTALPSDPMTQRSYAILTPARSGAAYEIDDFNTLASFASRPHPDDGYYYDEKSGIGFVAAVPRSPSPSAEDHERVPGSHYVFGPLKLFETRRELERLLGQGTERSDCISPSVCGRMLEYTDGKVLILFDVGMPGAPPQQNDIFTAVIVRIHGKINGIAHFGPGVQPVSQWKWGPNLPVLAIPPMHVPGWEVCDFGPRGTPPEGFCGGGEPNPRGIMVWYDYDKGHVDEVGYGGE